MELKCELCKVATEMIFQGSMIEKMRPFKREMG